MTRGFRRHKNHGFRGARLAIHEARDSRFSRRVTRDSRGARIAVFEARDSRFSQAQESQERGPANRDSRGARIAIHEAQGAAFLHSLLVNASLGKSRQPLVSPKLSLHSSRSFPASLRTAFKSSLTR